MKKLLYIILGVIIGASALTVSAQLRVFTAPQGGTGIGSATAGDVGDCLTVLDDSPFSYVFATCGSGSGDPFAWTVTSYGVSTSTRLGFLNGFLSTASSTIDSNLRITGNATATNATTTSLFSTTASTTNFFGADLSTCQSNNVLTWSNGRFGCETDDNTFPFTPDTNYGAVANATSTPIWFKLGLQASSTSHLVNFDATRSTTSYATTTSLFSTTASSTNLFTALFNGAGLSTCTGTNALTWSGGEFSCTAQPQGTVTTVTATTPIFSSGGATPNITWAGLATTSQPASSNLLVSNGGAGVYGVATSSLAVTSPITFSGTIGSQVGGAAGSFGCATCVLTSRALTIAGTAGQISSSAGSQDLSADRTWTLSLPSFVQITNLTVTNSTTTKATTTSATSTAFFSTRLDAITASSSVATTSQFFGAGLSSCTSNNVLTWSAGLFGCEADDAGSGAPDSKWATTTSTLNPNAIFASGGNNTLVGIGTSTPMHQLTVASTTGGQIGLSSGSGFSQWIIRNAGGFFYLATTTVAGTATSSFPALSINSNGIVQMSVSSTTIATTTSFFGANLTTCDATTGKLTWSGGTFSCGTDFNTLFSGSKWATTTTDSNAITTASASTVGIATTTPQWALQIASSTKSQLTLSDPSVLTNNHWSFRNAAGGLYVSTSSPTTFATSTIPAMFIDTNGIVRMVSASTTVLVVSSAGGTAGCATFSSTGLISNTGSACGSGGGTQGTFWATTTTPYLSIYPNGGTNVNVGVGTTTGVYTLTAASSSGPQIALSSSKGFSQWTLRNSSGNLYFSTTTTAGTATSTISALSIDTNGIVTIPSSLSLGTPLSATNGGTGLTALGAGVATWLGTPSSANLASAVTGETGSGALVFDTTPTFTTSALFPLGSVSVPGIAFTGDTNTGIWSPAAETIAFSTNAIEIARIDGNFDIGTTTDSGIANLTIASSTSLQLLLSSGKGFAQWGVRNAGGNLYFATTTVAGTATTTTAALSLMGSGKPGLSIGSTTPIATLSVNPVKGDYENQFVVGSSSATSIRIDNGGKIYVPSLTADAAAHTYTLCGEATTFELRLDTTTCVLSALKFKTNIADLDLGIKELMQVRPVVFNWKPTGDEKYDNNINIKHQQIGVIADEVEKIDSRLVTYDNQGEIKGFNYEFYTAWLTKAIQDIWQKVVGIDERVEKLEKENAELRARIEVIESKL